VAHPQKLYRLKDNTYPVPTPYDISGSAHWRNKADNCLTVWRDLDDEGHAVHLHVMKIRFREVGHIGEVTLQFNPRNGRYADTGIDGSRANGTPSPSEMEAFDVDA
jgi:twinkle protein